jgi:hypothetical protein
MKKSKCSHVAPNKRTVSDFKKIIWDLKKHSYGLIYVAFPAFPLSDLNSMKNGVIQQTRVPGFQAWTSRIRSRITKTHWRNFVGLLYKEN